jgi:hypothetical protein
MLLNLAKASPTTVENSIQGQDLNNLRWLSPRIHDPKVVK